MYGSMDCQISPVAVSSAEYGCASRRHRDNIRPTTSDAAAEREVTDIKILPRNDVPIASPLQKSVMIKVGRRASFDAATALPRLMGGCQDLRSDSSQRSISPVLL